jgi:hypothetical protein
MAKSIGEQEDGGVLKINLGGLMKGSKVCLIIYRQISFSTRGIFTPPGCHVPGVLGFRSLISGAKSTSSGTYTTLRRNLRTDVLSKSSQTPTSRPYDCCPLARPNYCGPNIGLANKKKHQSKESVHGHGLFDLRVLNKWPSPRTTDSRLTRANPLFEFGTIQPI